MCHYDGEMTMFVLELHQQELARNRTPEEQCVINILNEEGELFSAVLPSRVDHREPSASLSLDPGIHVSMNPAMLPL